MNTNVDHGSLSTRSQIIQNRYNHELKLTLCAVSFRRPGAGLVRRPGAGLFRRPRAGLVRRPGAAATYFLLYVDCASVVSESLQR